MCFSATASFTAGTVLVLVGMQALRLTRHRSEWPYALIPILFGLQQLLEGVLWLSIQVNAPAIDAVVTQMFSYFSQVLWPVYIPLAVWLLEPAGWRHRLLALITLAGAICSLFLLSYLVRLPVIAEVRGTHIVYIFPHFHVVAATGLYLLGTCIGPLFSSHRMVQFFGVAATLSFWITYLFYDTWFISVWCFFAGVLSCVVFWQFHRPHLLVSNCKPASVL